MNRPSSPETALDLPRSPFTSMIVKANPSILGDFDAWAFDPGMRFNSPDKWWGDLGKRDFPHEGLDFCRFYDPSGNRRPLATLTRIPVMFDGVVRAVFKDYLGQAIVVEHALPVGDNASQDRLLTVYAHTLPLEGVAPGRQLYQGDIMATIAGTRRSTANILPHLHLSVALPAPDLAFDAFVWNIMRDPARITLVDPKSLLDG